MRLLYLSGTQSRNFVWAEPSLLNLDKTTQFEWCGPNRTDGCRLPIGLGFLKQLGQGSAPGLAVFGFRLAHAPLWQEKRGLVKTEFLSLAAAPVNLFVQCRGGGKGRKPAPLLECVFQYETL